MGSQYSDLKWFGFLRDADTHTISEKIAADPNYVHRVYEMEFLVRISKTMGGNKEQTEDDIRGIPRVTIVRSPDDPRKRVSRQNDQHHFTNYLIRFQLNSLIQPSWWVRNRLLPELAKVKGLTMVNYGRPVQVN
jgi:hypothetical protein